MHSLKHDLMRIGETSQFIVQIVFRQGLLRPYSIVNGFEQGTNARKVISEVCAFYSLIHGFMKLLIQGTTSHSVFHGSI